MLWGKNNWDSCIRLQFLVLTQEIENVFIVEWKLLNEKSREWQRKGNYPSGLKEYSKGEVWSWVPQETGNGSPYVTLSRVTIEYITTLYDFRATYV